MLFRIEMKVLHFVKLLVILILRLKCMLLEKIWYVCSCEIKEIWCQNMKSFWTNTYFCSDTEYIQLYDCIKYIVIVYTQLYDCIKYMVIVYTQLYDCMVMQRIMMVWQTNLFTQIVRVFWIQMRKYFMRTGWKRIWLSTYW